MRAGERLVCLDLETGGLDPSKHPIIQIAAIAVDDSWDELESLECKILFDRGLAEPEALQLNGYDEDVWHAQALYPEQAMADIANFMRRHSTMEKISARTGAPYQIARLCGHNAPFDCSFLAAWFKRANQFCPASCFEPLDTLGLARWLSLLSPEPPKDHKLETLCAWMGIPLEQAHDALSDVRATVALARKLYAAIGGVA